MSVNNIWSADRDSARQNSYSSTCAQCNLSVGPMAGALVASYDRDGAALVNKALHPGCDLPSGFLFRAKFGEGKSMASCLGNAEETGEESTTDAQPEPAREPTEAELEATATAILERLTAKFLAAVPPLVKATMHEATRVVEFKAAPKAKPITVERAHKVLPDIVAALRARTNPLIVGPAGSGKTTLCVQAAEILGKPFYMSNSVAGKHELLGFRDAQGRVVQTDFFKAYTKGGLFLFDEADNSNPNALVAMNSAIANGICEFAGELHKAHKDFQVIASANTYGRGADQLYVGRNKLDAATLDRYQTWIMDYDEELERELCLPGFDSYIDWVQKVRSVIYAEKIPHVVSPRASMAGTALLAQGVDRSKVEEACVWKGLDSNHRARITARMGVVA